MRANFHVTMRNLKQEADEYCTNCQHYKKTVQFLVTLECQVHKIRDTYSIYLCKQCIEDMEEEGQAEIFLQLCPRCMAEIVQLKPTSEVPDFLPEEF